MPHALSDRAVARLCALAALAGLAFFSAMTIASRLRAEEGEASWYGPESGGRTASGERFHPDGIRRPDGAVAFTCARPSYRAGQPPYEVRVTDLASGRSVACRVNDRGPAAWTHRIIDLARGAAIALWGADGRGRPAKGTARVDVERASAGNP